MITGDVKEIALRGLSSAVSDYSCKDGELQVCHNMVQTGEGLRPIQDAVPIKDIEYFGSGLPHDFRGLVYVHNTSNDKVYLGATEDGHLCMYRAGGNGAAANQIVDGDDWRRASVTVTLTDGDYLHVCHGPGLIVSNSETGMVIGMNRVGRQYSVVYPGGASRATVEEYVSGLVSKGTYTISSEDNTPFSPIYYQLTSSATNAPTQWKNEEHLTKLYSAGGTWGSLYGGEVGSGGSVLDTLCKPGSYDISNVGNVLVVTVKDGGEYAGLHYLRYEPESGAYKYLGQRPPDIGVTFSGQFAANMNFDVPNRDTDDISIVGNVMQTDKMLYRLFAKAVESVHQNDIIKNIDNGVFDDSLFATVNYVQEECRKKGCFTKPFLVRYAYKMYDGNYIMHSSPVMIIPDDNISPRVYMLNGGEHDKVKDEEVIYSIREDGESTKGIVHYHTSYNMAWFYPVRLLMSVSDVAELGKWKDIIQEVCVFVTPEITSYSASGRIKGNVNAQNGKYFEHTESRFGKDITTITYPEYWSSFVYGAEIEMPKRDGSVTDWVEEACNNFRLIKSYSIDDIIALNNSITTVERSGGIANLNTFEQLIDGYAVRRQYVPKFIHSYNSRINIANVSYRDLGEFPPGFLGEGVGRGSYRADVFIEEEGVWQKVSASDGCNTLAHNMNGFFYYPNPNAKYLHVEGAWVKLKPHPFLNGAYYLNESLRGMETCAAPVIGTTGNLIHKPNLMFTSEVDNPFLFPALGVNSVGKGQIMAIKSATTALSEGEAHGTNPLYVFCTDGIYGLTVAGNGLYAASAPVSREVPLFSEAVIGIDNSVLFLSERGLMELSGARTRCLSAELGDRFSTFDAKDLPNFGLVCRGGYDEADEFMHYIKGGARIAFDYEHYRIIVYKPLFPSAYMYDIGTKTWCTFTHHLMSSVQGYPATYVNTLRNVENNKIQNVCQFSASTDVLCGDGEVQMVTRPLKMGMPDVLKTVRKILMRGSYRNKATLKLALWGSRDMQQWQYIGGVKEGSQIARLSGSGYKYFIVAGSGRLDVHGDAISRLTVEEMQKQTNKLR